MRFDSSGNHGFVYSIPPALAPNGSARFEVRFAESSQHLQGSPFELGPLGEALHAPFKTSDLTGQRVLVLAPHPDDESLTCGGSIALHVDNRDPVRVVFLTDGSRAVRNDDQSCDEYVAARRREALEACQTLGVNDVEFWPTRDRALAASPDALDKLCEALDAYRPELVYAPSPQEFHPDHRAAAELIWRAVNKTGIEADVAFYESNRPIHINRLVDIGAVNERKLQACNAYKSQLQNHPYTEMVLSLSRYRALTVSPGVTHAEGFFVLSSAEMREHPPSWFTIRQHLPMATPGCNTRPLVSVIIRTKNRRNVLREALSSVLTQTYPNIEVVVVDAGSDDISAVVAEFEPYFLVRIVRSEQSLGRAAAATLGAKTATGKYVNYLDDDDLLYAEHIEKLVGFLETTGERVAYSDCEQIHFEWDKRGPRPTGEAQPFHGLDYDRTRLLIGNYLPIMTVLFERTLAEEVGYFDESLEVLEDWDFWIRASKRTDFHRVPGVTALYRMFIERPHGRSVEVMHRRLRDEWDELAASAQKRTQCLQAENDKLDEAIDEARRGLRALRSTLAWNFVASLPQVALKALGFVEMIEPDSPPQPMVSEPFSAWRRRAGEAWSVIEELQRQNQAKREQLAVAERRFRAAQGNPLQRLIRLTPRPILERAHQAYRWVVPYDSPPVERETIGSDEDVELRLYRAGDEPRILELFRLCFGVQRDLPDWTWKYVQHPWGAKKIIVATASDGRLLAHYAGYPTRFLDATGDEPRILTGLQIGDTMTAPAVRGLGGGRGGLLRRITEYYFEQFCERQVDFNFGFNTGKIQRYYLRHIPGSHFFEDVPFMALDCTDAALTNLGEIGSRLPSCEVRRVRKVDVEWDRLFDQCASEYGMLTLRNREYVRWRYLDRPGADYQIYAAYDSGALIGWSVFVRDGKRLVWGDGLVARASAGAFARIVAYAMEQAANRDARSTDGWFSSRPDWWSQTAAEAGFKRRPEPNRIAMIYKPFASADPGELFATNLYYTAGDSDLF